jgi:hypothetical protein
VAQQPVQLLLTQAISFESVVKQGLVRRDQGIPARATREDRWLSSSKWPCLQASQVAKAGTP